MDIMTFTKTILKNLLSKPVTRLYPQKPRIYPQRTRGHISIDIDTCVFCGLCAKKCPTGAITVNRVERSWSIERFGCIQCSACVESCNKNSLSMQQSYTEPDRIKIKDVIVQSVEDDVVSL
jgi:formate hydrogenlyase subunit 6/NADH:ubiquinone oxidoreductase subunit I